MESTHIIWLYLEEPWNLKFKFFLDFEGLYLIKKLSWSYITDNIGNKSCVGTPNVWLHNYGIEWPWKSKFKVAHGNTNSKYYTHLRHTVKLKVAEGHTGQYLNPF